MKNSQLTPVLLGITAVSALLSIILVGWSFAYARQLGPLRNQVAFIHSSRPMINALAGELIEYSKKNPSIDPILYSTGVKQSTAPAPAAAKPATK